MIPPEDSSSKLNEKTTQHVVTEPERVKCRRTEKQSTVAMTLSSPNNSTPRCSLRNRRRFEHCRRSGRANRNSKLTKTRQHKELHCHKQQKHLRQSAEAATRSGNFANSE